MSAQRPISHRFRARDVDLAVHDWGGPEPGGPARPILLAHATGFHGVIWRPVARGLVEAGHHVYSFDFRGHGDSDAPDIEYRWEDFAGDVLDVVEHLGLAGRNDLVGVGHSKGAASLVMAEAGAPATFERLWLYEPIIFPGDPPPGPIPDNPLAQGARRRRMVWSSPDEAFEAYASKPPLQVLDEDALRAYVDHGLRRGNDGKWELKCRGEIEARVYSMGSAHEGYQRLPDVRCPALVLCGEHTDAIPADFGRLLVDRLPAGRFELAKGLGHFGPLEDPGAAVASILEFVASAGGGDG